MMQLTIISALDAAQADCPPLRLHSGDLPVGSETWLNTEFPLSDLEWIVTASHLYRSQGGAELRLAAIAKAGVIPDEPELPLYGSPFRAFVLYLDEVGEIACESYREEDEPPAIGVFTEYEPGGTSPLPPRRVVSRFERFTTEEENAPYSVIYVAHLDLITTPVLALV